MGEIDYDYVIGGAGCAGLGLASEICRQKDVRLALVDGRIDFSRDRTWCFWDLDIDSKSLPVRRRWTKFMVRRGRRRIERHCRQYQYCCLLSEDFYRTKREITQSSPNCHEFYGEPIEHVDFADSVVIHTAKRKIRTNIFFDSRPPVFRQGELLQDFFGLHLIADTDAFEPDCVTLMDFQENDVCEDGFHFFYVLPFSKREALIESVVVGRSRLPREHHARLLTAYLKSQFSLCGFTEVYREHNCLPMHRAQPATADERHVAIGVRGGAMRASTGYAFAAICRANERMARDLPRAHALAKQHWSARAVLLDAVMLEYLKRHPHDGPLLLSSLFFDVNPYSTIRFLCDRSSLFDEGQILSVMPRKLELALIMAELSASNRARI